MESVIVHYQWSSISETSSKTLGDEEVDVEIGQPASSVEVLNWKLSDCQKTQHTSQLSSSGVVSPVPV